MAELKTKPTKASMRDFIKKIPDKKRRDDSEAVLKLMKEATGTERIVGFGRYRYKYDSGREGEWMLTGFSPRKSELTVYIMAGFAHFPELLKELVTKAVAKMAEK